jgi:hypothetical protein
VSLRIAPSRARDEVPSATVERLPVYLHALDRLRASGAPLGTLHAWSQPPQWARFACGSTHAPPQHDWPVGQGRAAVHPITHTPPTVSSKILLPPGGGSTSGSRQTASPDV